MHRPFPSIPFACSISLRIRLYQVSRKMHRSDYLAMISIVRYCHQRPMNEGKHTVVKAFILTISPVSTAPFNFSIKTSDSSRITGINVSIWLGENAGLNILRNFFQYSPSIETRLVFPMTCLMSAYAGFDFNKLSV